MKNVSFRLKYLPFQLFPAQAKKKKKRQKHDLAKTFLLKKKKDIDEPRAILAAVAWKSIQKDTQLSTVMRAHGTYVCSKKKPKFRFSENDSDTLWYEPV